MPIPLDLSLPESLYPLAWLVGTWEGEGAVQLRGEDGEIVERRVEQRLQATPTEEGQLSWHAVTHLIDTAAPLPPTSAFAKDGTVPPRYVGTGERHELLDERGVWTVGEPLPGQDLAAARAARPGDPAGIVSYALDARFAGDDSADGDPTAAPAWRGEVRGPRIQLGVADPLPETRLFGLVGGRLMWLWERAADAAHPEDLRPYLSVELDRV
ncbi:FABP family protein [Brachybacterium sp. EF45031]|uniref:FABP family protein n=1 Tax=Brachybacterium sillae TaxID=2810536 RepID=UPI00217D924F|nr:FABP family protein [Brachybacterium sillae]MCS6712161.1 FABP family protein [Brachybacterium sillae]